MQENFTTQNIPPEPFFIFERRKVKKTAMSVGIAFIILLFIPRVCIYAFFWAMAILGQNGAKIITEPAFQQLWQIVVSILMMVIPAFIIPRLEKKKTAELISFKRPRKRLFLPFVLIGIGVCAFANIATNVIASIMESFGFFYSAPEVEVPSGVFGVVLVILSTAVTPALVEEFLMRGSVLGSIKDMGEDVAVIVSAVLFGLMHGNFVQMPFAFIVGLILGMAVIKTGSLWTGVAIHFINNFMSVLLVEFLPLGDSVFLNSAVTAGYFMISLTLGFVGILMLKGRSKEALSLSAGELTASFKEKLLWFFTSPLIIIGIALTIAEGAGWF